MRFDCSFEALERRLTQLEDLVAGGFGRVAPSSGTMELQTWLLAEDLWQGITAEAVPIWRIGSQWEAGGEDKKRRIAGEFFRGYGFAGRIVVADRTGRAGIDLQAIAGGIHYVRGTVAGVFAAGVEGEPLEQLVQRVDVNVIDSEPFPGSFTPKTHVVPAYFRYNHGVGQQPGIEVGCQWCDNELRWHVTLEPCVKLDEV